MKHFGLVRTERDSGIGEPPMPSRLEALKIIRRAEARKITQPAAGATSESGSTVDVASSSCIEGHLRWCRKRQKMDSATIRRNTENGTERRCFSGSLQRPRTVTTRMC